MCCRRRLLAPASRLRGHPPCLESGLASGMSPGTKAQGLGTFQLQEATSVSLAPAAPTGACGLPVVQDREEGLWWGRPRAGDGSCGPALPCLPWHLHAGHTLPHLQMPAQGLPGLPGAQEHGGCWSCEARLCQVYCGALCTPSPRLRLHVWPQLGQRRPSAGVPDPWAPSSSAGTWLKAGAPPQRKRPESWPCQPWLRAAVTTVCGLHSCWVPQRLLRGHPLCPASPLHLCLCPDGSASSWCARTQPGPGLGVCGVSRASCRPRAAQREGARLPLSRGSSWLSPASDLAQVLYGAEQGLTAGPAAAPQDAHL